MSTTLALALQLTAVNGVSGVMSRIRDSILNLGGASKSVKRDFDAMNASIAKGLSALATHSYLKSKLQPGIQAASDMQEAMLKVEGSIKTTTMSAGELNKQLKAVRDTSFDVSKAAPMSQTEVTDIQNSLLKSGVNIDSVTGKRGAAWAATGLSTLSGIDPGQVGDMLARIGNQNNLKGDEYGTAADTLMRAEAASPGDLGEIMYSMRQFGTNATMLKVPFKDQAAAAATLTPLGMEAGTAMNRFLEDSTGKNKHQQGALKELGLGKGEGKEFKSAFFDNGKYIGVGRSIALIREKMALIKDDSVKLRLATQIWGEEGARAALIFANAKPGKGFDDMLNGMAQSLGIEERMDIRMRGLNMQTKALAGTIQSSLAVAFDPVLDKLSTMKSYMNDLTADAGKWAGEHRTTSGVVAGGTIAAVAGVGLYGLLQLLKSGWHGGKMLKGLATDGASLAGGVAEGKALQAATGVTPVFVTNFAQMTGGGGVGGAAADVATGAVAGGVLKKLALSAGLLRAAPSMAAIAEMGASAVGVAAAAVVAAGAVGYGAGKVGMSFASDDFKDKIGGTIATILARFGNKDAQEALNITLNIDGKQVATVVNAHNASQAKRH